MSGDPVAAVVCTRDRPEMLERALAAVLGALRPHDEAVVVDSASRSPATASVARAAGLPLVRCDRPGLARARNAGVAATSAPVVAFTDDDCLPDADWLEVLAGSLSGDPGLGFVTGRVEADRDERAVSVFVDPHRRDLGPGDDVLTMGHGANMAFKRQALDELGGFDERFGAGGRYPAAEDTDAFWRLLRAGWRGRYEPDAVVTHRQWRSRSDVLRVEYRYGKGGGAFAAKVRRADPVDGSGVIRRLLWAESLAPGLRHLRAGHRMAAATCALRLAGTVSGLAQAWRIPVGAPR